MLFLPRIAWTRPTALAVVAALALVLAGCRQQAYLATELPSHLVAAPVENLDAIDFAGLSSATSGGEVIECGDLLGISLWTDIDEKAPEAMPIRVSQDGKVNVPPVGTVAVAGLRAEAAEEAIARAAIDRQMYRNPHVTVEMKRQRSYRVMVAGAVHKPGTYEIARGNSTLLAALVEAGGLSGDASAEVEIRRPSTRRSSGEGVQAAAFEDDSGAGGNTEHVNLFQAAASRSIPSLEDGAVVVVGRRPPRVVRVMGLVAAPGEFQLPANQDVYLLDALAMAGGRKSEIADEVLIIRRLPEKPEPERIRVSVREAKNNPIANIRIAAGDLITVEETPLTFTLDAIKTFFRVSVGGSLGTFF